MIKQIRKFSGVEIRLMLDGTFEFYDVKGIRKTVYMTGKYHTTKYRGRKVGVHRLICKAWHGTFNPRWEVHHIDSNPINNHPDNLIAIPKSLHRELHRKQQVIKRRLDSFEIKKMLLGIEKKDLAIENSELRSLVEGYEKILMDNNLL